MLEFKNKKKNRFQSTHSSGIFITVLHFGESVANLCEFIQFHLYISTCNAYTPLMVKFRDEVRGLFSSLKILLF